MVKSLRVNIYIYIRTNQLLCFYLNKQSCRVMNLKPLEHMAFQLIFLLLLIFVIVLSTAEKFEFDNSWNLNGHWCTSFFLGNSVFFTKWASCFPFFSPFVNFAFSSSIFIYFCDGFDIRQQKYCSKRNYAALSINIYYQDLPALILSKKYIHLYILFMIYIYLYIYK